VSQVGEICRAPEAAAHPGRTKQGALPRQQVSTRRRCDEPPVDQGRRTASSHPPSASSVAVGNEGDQALNREKDALLGGPGPSSVWKQPAAAHPRAAVGA